MPGFQEIFKYLESALTSSFFFIFWKIPINISPLRILAFSGASPRLHCSPPSVIWQRMGLCLVLGTGSLLLALAALGGVNGTRCAVYKRGLLTKTRPAQGPVGPPLKSTAVFPKMFFCFVLFCFSHKCGYQQYSSFTCVRSVLIHLTDYVLGVCGFLRYREAEGWRFGSMNLRVTNYSENRGF